MERWARSEAGYEETRTGGIWQAEKPDRFPDLIVRPRDPKEVVDAVREAIAAGALISVKGSGHNYTCTYLRDGGVLLDLSALDAIEVEDEIARVGPGARSGAVCAALNAAGRAFPTGHHYGVGMGGYLLGGGMGWNGEHWGQLACFNVEAVDVVLATGELVTISEHDHPELFWAARGAGSLFPAVATGFRVRTMPLPTALTGLRAAYPLEAVPAVAEWLTAVGAAAHPDVETILILERHPQTHEPHGLVLALYHGSNAPAGHAALREIATGLPAGDGEVPIFPLTYEALNSESLTGPARRTAADTAWTGDPLAATLIAAERYAQASSPGTVVIINYRGEPSLPGDAAASVIGQGFLEWLAQWDDAADDADNLAWVQATTEALEHLTIGAYINESDLIRRPERARRCFSAAAWDRLNEVRNLYDPERRFPGPQVGDVAAAS